jgi:hypothetical protein
MRQSSYIVNVYWFVHMLEYVWIGTDLFEDLWMAIIYPHVSKFRCLLSQAYLFLPLSTPWFSTGGSVDFLLISPVSGQVLYSLCTFCAW